MQMRNARDGVKLIFFDMDGTLCVPEFKNKNGERVVGFTDEGWYEYCTTMGEDGYKDCIPVQPVIRYARVKKEEGAKLFVLSTAHTKEETAAKINFVKTKLKGLFDEVVTVEHDADKIPFMLNTAKNMGMEACDCEIVEDTYATILKSNDAGIKATHISSIVCDL